MCFSNIGSKNNTLCMGIKCFNSKLCINFKVRCICITYVLRKYIHKVYSQMYYVVAHDDHCTMYNIVLKQHAHSTLVKRKV